uniref:Notch ligand N-terminal domain-containing protein n=1 Tax=Knipowitschia caucasica TaxID=637954 RepID=A0AAV2MG80_KNICA
MGTHRTRIRESCLPLVCRLLLLLTLWTELSQSTGHFELQLISVENVNGELADGECCDGPRNNQDLRCTRDECDTYFRVCLKEYQAEVTTGGGCTYGAATTQVLGGNMFSFQGNKNSPNKMDEAGKISIPFQFAWPSAVGSRVRLGPECGWVQSAVGSRVRLGPECGWVQSAVGSRVRLGPECGWGRGQSSLP